MKNTIKYIAGIVLICLAGLSEGISSAQSPMKNSADFPSAYSNIPPFEDFRMNIDRDLYILRNDLFPNLNYEFDDFLQYAPAGVMLGLKAFGYEGRTNWPGLIVSDAFSVAIMAATVNGLKYTVKRPRPDGSSFNSFPSGHTATAFMTATMLHKEYGWRSPWFSIGSYTAATFTAYSRLLNNRHWMSDILAGAAIGIGSGHLGYFITDKIFQGKHIYDG